MANPTTYFGWVMPTSSSLVTNLPADFNTFGQGVDTSLQDLLGGTTGQVLSKTSATNMDFTWVTPTDQTPLTTKGDLFTFTTVDARLAVGSNGETLVANSAASTGLSYSATPSASNPVINSAMQVWQRGTSIAVGATISYTTDRWQGWRNGSVAGETVSRQVTNDTTNLPNIQYCARVQRDSGNTSTAYMSFSQLFESTNSIPFAGKTVTFSFYARAGANYSPTSSILQVGLSTGTGTDQNWITGMSGYASNLTNYTLTTTWQRFTVTQTIPTTATQIVVNSIANVTGTAGANDYYEITGVQIDIGSVALPFRTYAATIQGELAACQRYYQRYATSAYERFGVGGGQSSTIAIIQMPLKVTMRVAPTSIDYSTLGVIDSGGSITTGAVPTGDAASKDFYQVAMTVASGLTQYRPYFGINNNSSSGFIGFSAEL